LSYPIAGFSTFGKFVTFINARCVVIMTNAKRGGKKEGIEIGGRKSEVREEIDVRKGMRKKGVSRKDAKAQRSKNKNSLSQSTQGTQRRVKK